MIASTMKNGDIKEIPLQLALKEQELELTSDGRYIRWANTNPRHPRNWHPLRKVFDIGVIILLEFYTLVVPSVTLFSTLTHAFRIEPSSVLQEYVKFNPYNIP